MISFEEFKKYMQIYKSILQKENKLSQALEEMSKNFGGFCFEDVHNLFLKMITSITKDKGEWISYYIFELDWGKKYQDGYVTDKDGSNIPLKTLQDLYKLLKKGYEDETAK